MLTLLKKICPAASLYKYTRTRTLPLVVKLVISVSLPNPMVPLTLAALDAALVTKRVSTMKNFLIIKGMRCCGRAVRLANLYCRAALGFTMRCVEAGSFCKAESGRIGRVTKLPPQLGQV